MKLNNIFKPLTLGLALLSTPYTEASSNTCEEDYSNITASSAEKVFLTCLELAKKGDNFSQDKVSFMYALGQGTTQDDTKAFESIKNTVEGGNDDSALVMAFMYKYGLGIKKDTDKALKIYLMLSENGYAKGSSKAGLIYLSRNQDKEAFSSFKMAAEQGSSSAKYLLGLKYLARNSKEPLIEKDYKNVLKWLHELVEEGVVAEQLAEQLVEEGFVNKYVRLVNTHYILGMMYKGEGPKKDINKAINHLKKAAEEGDKDSQQVLSQRNSYETNNWDLRNDWSVTRYTDNKFNIEFINSHLGFSENQEKRIYFEIPQKLKKCLPADYSTAAGSFLETVWEFNNQAIKITMFCKAYSNSEETYISATPSSVEGHNFIINAFKKSSKPIMIKGAGLEFPVSAKGFSKVWGSISRAL